MPAKHMTLEAGDCKAAALGVSKTAGVTKKTTSTPSQPSQSSTTAVKTSNEKPETMDVSPDPSLTVSLEDMPLDVLARIVGYLSFIDMFKLELVSCKMYDVIQIVWKQVKGISTCSKYYRNRSKFVNKYQCADDIDDRIAKAVIKRGNIRHLEAGTAIGNCKLSSDFFTDDVASAMPNLQRITLEVVFITNADVTNLATYCPQLTHVTFNSCLDTCSYEKSLGLLFQNCKQLTYVDLQRNHYFKGVSLKFLPSTVRHLNLAQDPQIKATTMRNIVKACPELTSFVVDITSLKIEDINQMLCGLKNVKSLGIFNDEHPRTPFYLDFSHNFDLEVLFIEESKYVTPETFQSLAENCKKFRSLTFIFCYFLTMETIQSIAECKSLKTLYLSGCFELSDAKHIVNSCGIQYLRHAQDQKYSKEAIAKFIDETPTLNGLHSVIKKPRGFDFEGFVADYFSDQLESMADGDGVVNQDRPLFQIPSEPSGARLAVRQSLLKKMTYESGCCEQTSNNVLEFGTLG